MLFPIFRFLCLLAVLAFLLSVLVLSLLSTRFCFFLFDGGDGDDGVLCTKGDHDNDGDDCSDNAVSNMVWVVSFLSGQYITL